ncbi:MAG: cell division protein FtsA [Bacteroidia bacterium]|nr:cell division protein FtsA [Bacteroidia bacterium]
MEKNNYIVGLDIGTTKICAIVGRRNEFGKIEITGMGKAESLGVTRGMVTNILQTINSIKSAVSETESKAAVGVHNVYVGIAGQHIKSLQHRGMKMRAINENEINQQDIDAIVDEMYRLAMPPGEEIIHVIPQEYIVDNAEGIKDPVGMPGTKLEANCHVITGHIQAVKNINKCVERSGLNAVDLFLEPLASADAVLTEEEKDAGVVLVDIGGGTTDIAIFQDGIIRHTAVIPFGGNVITEDIKAGCSIIRAQAEQLKINFGSAMANLTPENEVVTIPGLKGRESKEISVKNLAHIIQSRMDEIISLVHHQIIISGYEKKLIAGIVITGGGAQLTNIVQLFEFVTGMDTRIGYPNEHLGKSVEDVMGPMYATGVGLVMKGFQEYDKMKAGKPLEVTENPLVKQGEKKRGGFFDAIKDFIRSDHDDKEL